MRNLLFFLTQTKNDVIIEMFSLLLGSVIIGYITVQLYYRSFNIISIKNILSELEELKNHNLNLNLEKSNLQKFIREKNNKIINLINKIHYLQAEAIRIRNIKKKPESSYFMREKPGIYYHNFFGLACKNQVINLYEIKKIGLWVEEKRMFELYFSEQFNKLIPIVEGCITEVLDISPDIRVNRVAQVHELAKKQLYQSMN
jgi:hypothetical protein